MTDDARRMLADQFVLDTPPLHHFALADRLDVLRDLLLQDQCQTTAVVVGELKNERTNLRSRCCSMPSVSSGLRLPL